MGDQLLMTAVTASAGDLPTIDEILAFYEEVLGPPTVTSDESTIWSIFENNTLTTATIIGTDGDVEIGIPISSP